MLGLGSLEMALAYWLCLIGGAFCVWWGWRNWNAPSEPDRLRYKKYVYPGRAAPDSAGRPPAPDAAGQDGQGGRP